MNKLEIGDIIDNKKFTIKIIQIEKNKIYPTVYIGLDQYNKKWCLDSKMYISLGFKHI